MFGYRNLARRLLRIALPAVGENLLYMAIGFVDVGMLGRLGPGPLTAVTLGAEIFFVTVSFLAAIGMGGTVLSAQATGARQVQKVNDVAGQTLLLALGLGVVTGVPLYFGAPLLVRLFPVEPEVYSMVIDYLEITTLVAPAVLCLYMGNGIFRGIGRTEIPLMLATVSNIINIVGDYLLIFGKCGFPALGVRGAAIATSTAYLTACTLLMAIMFSGRYGVKLNMARALWPKLHIIKEMFRLGAPAAIEDTMRGSGGVIASYFLTRLGTVAFAAHQISLTVESLSFMPGAGLAVAATSLVGQSLGAKRIKEARASAYASLVVTGAIMGSAGLIFCFFPGYVAFLFTNDRELVSMASLCIRIAAIYQLAMGAEMVLAGVLRGAGDTRTPMLVSLMGIWLVRIPGLWLIVDVWQFDLIAVWWLIVIDRCFRSLAILAVFLRGKWLSMRIEV